LSRIEPGGLAAGNAIIDEAAVAAGRDPRAIRRLVNVGGEAENREELLRMAIEDGVSTFISMGDDPVAMQRFIEEVAPDLRARVAAERRSTA
jgi:xanthine dehydrogenase molybdopterin-binding subunit B